MSSTGSGAWIRVLSGGLAVLAVAFLIVALPAGALAQTTAAPEAEKPKEDAAAKPAEDATEEPAETLTEEITVTARLREESAAGGSVLDRRADRRGAARPRGRRPRGRRRQRSGLHRPEPRPRPEPGGHARRLRRPDRARPARRQGAGRHLPRRLGDLALALHPRHRPLRHVARRGAARTAGHALRTRARSPAPCATSPTSRSSAAPTAIAELDVQLDHDGGIGGSVKAPGQRAARRHRGDARRRLLHQLRRLHRRRAARSRGERRRQRRRALRRPPGLPLHSPTRTSSITPRLLYQEVDMNGWNRIDAFNILGQPVHHHAAGGRPRTSASSSPSSTSRSPTSSCSPT